VDLLSFGATHAPARGNQAVELWTKFGGIRAIDPLGFLEVLQLEARAWR
jgi:hypothetical protein